MELGYWEICLTREVLDQPVNWFNRYTMLYFYTFKLSFCC